jgi:DHA1 family bicyclomycin/chloramphenicol resistance-like MFS transporter
MAKDESGYPHQQRFDEMSTPPIPRPVIRRLAADMNAAADNPAPAGPLAESDGEGSAAPVGGARFAQCRRRKAAGPGVLVLLVAATTMGQVGINIALPSMPGLAVAFETSPGLAGLSLTLFVVALALSQLFWGPLSDGFGRRRAILMGASIYLVATAACIVAPGIEVLIAARAMQGVGAGAGLVIGRAGIGDTFSGTALMKASGYATIAIGIVPAVAPVVGGLLHDGFGWQGGYAATLLYACLLLVALWLGLPESNGPASRKLAPSRVVGDYAAVVRSRSFVGYALTNALGLGALYAFYAGSPGFFIGINGLKPSAYGAVLVGNSAAYILGSILTTRMCRDRPAVFLLRIAGLTMLLGAALLLLLVPMGGIGSVPIILSAYLFALGLGMTLPVGFAAVLAMFEDRKGTAAAVLGCLQLTVAALASAAVGLFGTSAATHFPVVMCLMAGASLPCSWWLVAAHPAYEGGLQPHST